MASLEVLREDFVRTARAKGLGKREVLWKHVLRNAMIPVMTVMGLQFANLLAGTIVIDTPNKFLFLVQGDGRALRYGIGVGRPGFTWSGVKTISAKKEWPAWTPPPEMLARRPDLPRHMEGGPENPLGARAMYLGATVYRIHGTNQPQTIGTAVLSGCFRLTNPDVTDLYDRIPVGTKVIIRQRPEV
jgi:lipoprotein-anchoring transpeptidase ErfK/SrfK